MAQQLQPDTLNAWMRIVERRLGFQERRNAWSPDDLYALTDDIDGGGGGGGGELPPGGTDGQVLTKQSDADGDAFWENVVQQAYVDSHDMPPGGNATQVLAKIDGTNYHTHWVTQTGGGGGGSDEVTVRPDDPATDEPTVELWVDTDDTSTGVSVPTPITDWNLAIPGGYYYGIGNTPNAPSTATYAGITYTDGQPGHFTQVVYRIASTSTSVEQWQRQMIGGTSWTPWTPVLGPDTGWVPLTGYLPGWGPGTFGYPSAYRIQNGRCRMRGNVKNVNAWVQGGNNILTLPVAARPAQVCEFTGAITTNTSAVTQRIEIGGQTGTVIVTSTNAFSAGTWVSLDGIEYDLI